MTTEPTREQSIDHLWRIGELSYLLREVQEEIRTEVIESDAVTSVVNCSRRLGKTFTACVLAVEQCLQLDHSQVHYAAPTGKAVRKMVLPAMWKILTDCPSDLVPSFNATEGCWSFPNGSQIHVAGVNNDHADDLRGTDTHLGIVDEAGFVDDLRYLVDSVLMPQCLTTDGRLLLISTPPKTPAHAFALYCASAEASGSYTKRTIYDASHITPERRAKFCAEAGGEHSTAWQREYECRFVVDSDKAVFPEFTDAEGAIVMEWPQPAHFFPYVVGDAGFKDLSVLALGYYDFAAGLLIIEDEVVARRKTSTAIDDAVKAKELELWGTRKVHTRAVDLPPIALAEINTLARPWSITRKDDLDASVNATRLVLANRKIRIHPRCKTIIAHSKHAIWNAQRSDFYRERESQESGDASVIPVGHFDGAACLHYFVRRVDRTSNPYPNPLHALGHADHFIDPALLVDPRERALQKLFTRRPR